MAQSSLSATRDDRRQERPLRADAQQNRDRAVEAARVVFSELGVDAPMAEVARRAGVGLATLFRRFPTKDDLLLEVFADHIDGCVTAIDHALADSDPWHAIKVLVTDVCTKQSSDRAFASFLVWTLTGEVSLDVSTHVESGFVELIARAKASKRLQQDVEYSDIILILMANAGVVAMSNGSVAADSRRTVELMLTSFENENTRIDEAISEPECSTSPSPTLE